MLPFRIQQIDHVVLRVSDPERSLRFYQQVLGCELARRRDDLGLLHLRAGASLIDLVDIHGPLGGSAVAAPPAGQGGNMDHFCLRIEPFDETALLAHLERHGLVAQKAVERYGAEGTGPSIYCSDPDGNRVELKGPAGACPPARQASATATPS